MSIKEEGLTRHDIKHIAWGYGLRHTPECREHNKDHYDKCHIKWILYHCVCDFMDRVKSKVFSFAFNQDVPWQLAEHD
jgi:hypothetical protein